MVLTESEPGALCAPSKQQIDRLERELLALPQAEVPTEHTFGPGFYARTITLEAGTVLTGKVHSTEHIFIVSKGDITLVSEEGRRRVQAPFQMVSKPGTKRAGYAHTEVVCTNVHITTETDLVRLEAALIEPEALPAPDTKECIA